MPGVEPAVVSACAGALGAAISAFVAFRNGTRDRDRKDGEVADRLSGIETKLAVMESKMDTLSERVHKHNGVMERMFKLEAREDELERDIHDMKVGGTDD